MHISPIIKMWHSRPLLSAQLTALLRDESGNGLIEFALGLPIMLLIYFGTVNISDAITLQRKIITATRAVADLTTKSQSFTTATITSGVFAGSNLVISPYSLTNATTTVTDMCTDANGVTTKKWSVQSVGNAAPAAVTIPASPSNQFTLPVGVKQNGTCLIQSTISYAYSPLLGSNFIGPFTISDIIYMSPRNLTDITFTP